MPFILWTEILATLFCLALGTFVVFTNPKNLANRKFALFSLALAVWIPLDLIQYVADPRAALMLMIYRLAYIGGSFITFTFMQFMNAVAGDEPSWVDDLTKWLAVGFAIVAQTGLLIQGLQLTKDMANPIEEIHGPLYAFFIVFFVGSLLCSLAPLIRRYPKAEGEKRKQLQYILLAFVLGLVAVINFFANNVNTAIPPLFYLFIAGLMATFATAITRHKLMDVHVVIRQTVAYSLVTGTLAAIMLFVGLASARLTAGLFGQTSVLAIAGTACLIAAIFHPLQLKIQSFVDRYLFPGWKDREVVREIAAGFSHELKSPLAALGMQVQMALLQVKDLQNSKTLSKQGLNDMEKRLQTMLNQTMETAKRIEAVRGVAEPAEGQAEAVAISTVINHSLLALQALVAKVNAQVDCELPTPLPPVLSNAAQLEIVFTNVLKNSLEAMNQSPRRSLSIRAQENPESVLVSIRDSGVGIDSKNRERLFQSFFTTKGGQGTGMGLYMSRQIIEAFGGTIDVKSEEGIGTEFVVTLKRA